MTTQSNLSQQPTIYNFKDFYGLIWIKGWFWPWTYLGGLQVEPHPQLNFLLLRKHKLWINRTKFNVNPQKCQNLHEIFSGYAPGFGMSPVDAL